MHFIMCRREKKQTTAGKTGFQKELCAILNTALHDKISKFMNCINNALDMKNFNFEFFGSKGYKSKIFLKYRDEFEKWSIDDNAVWRTFFLNVGGELLKVAGLKEAGLVKLTEDEIEESIATKIALRNRDLSNKKDKNIKDTFVGKNRKCLKSNEKHDDDEKEVPPYFYSLGDGIVHALHEKWKRTEKVTSIKNAKAMKQGESSSKNYGEERYSVNTCPIDSIMSILIFLDENCFEQEDKEEFHLNLPVFSIIIQLLNRQIISCKQFKYFCHSMLQVGKLHEQEMLRDVYRRFKELMGASPGDPLYMSLFSTPFFDSRAFCQRDCVSKRDLVMKEKMKREKEAWEGGVKWITHLRRINTWGSNLYNAFEASFIETIGAQQYCGKCGGTLTHTSYLKNYPNFYSIFNNPETDLSELLLTCEINFSSIKYKLVSILYSNHDFETVLLTDHFVSIVRKEHNGTTSYFICDTLNDYRKPKLLENVNTFPAVYDENYYPTLLVFQKFVLDTSSKVVMSEAFKIEDLGEDCDYALEIELQEKLPLEYESEICKKELANYYFLSAKENKFPPRLVGFSRDAKETENMLSLIYACMQVFFSNNFLAFKILTSQAQSSGQTSELLLAMQMLLVSLRYSVEEISYNPYLENAVRGADVFVDVMTTAHDKFLDLDQQLDTLNDDALSHIKTLCLKASSLNSVCMDRLKTFSNLETLSILNSSCTGQGCSFGNKISVNNVDFMLVGFIGGGKLHGAEDDCYSAYAKNWDSGEWRRFYFNDVVRIDDNDIFLRLQDGKISYVSYVKCDLNQKYKSEMCEEIFKHLVSHMNKEDFLPIPNLMHDFCNDDLFIRKPCKHGSYNKERVKMGNIMPLKYMTPTEASFAKRFYHFCPIFKCNDSYFEDMTKKRKRRQVIDGDSD
jgi:hypothetical protein